MFSCAAFRCASVGCLWCLQKYDPSDMKKYDLDHVYRVCISYIIIAILNNSLSLRIVGGYILFIFYTYIYRVQSRERIAPDMQCMLVGRYIIYFIKEESECKLHHTKDVEFFAS